MKNFGIKSLNGKWYQGEITVRYNLLAIFKFVVSLLIIALVCYVIFILGKGLWWCFEKTAPVFIWIGDNWWWLLLSLLGLSGLIWAWLKGLFKRRPKTERPQRKSKKSNWWWLLLPLLLLLGILFFWRGCEKEAIVEKDPKKQQEIVYEKSFDKVIIARAYLDGVQKETSKTCPRALVGFKFINDKSAKDYNFEGMTYDESVRIVANDWKPLVLNNLSPDVVLSEQQMVVVTLAAMRMGKYGFPRSTFLKKVNEGDFKGATNWLLLQTENGEIRKLGEEPTQYFYMLRVLWNEEIMVDELLDLPMFSYRALSVQKLYNNGSYIWNNEIKGRLSFGYNTTPRVALEL